ncbi:MAG: beta-1,6-N-acetylglucosaminyltransferase [Pseudomonadota bacterium]
MNFLLGKFSSSLFGFLAMVFVVRGLSIKEFGQYSILIALVEFGVALAGFGGAQVLLRYVPDLFGRSQKAALDRLVSMVVSLRSLLLLLLLVLVFACSNIIASTVGLGDAIRAFEFFLLIVFFRGTLYLLSQVLESTLHQGWAQFGFSASAIVRLIGVLYLTHTSELTLMHVIWLEAAADALAVIILIFAIAKEGLAGGERNPESTEMGKAWLRENAQAILRFALAGYLQHLAILPYGGHTNRLVGGAILGPVAMAAYGFAQSLYEYIKRYLPAQLLMGAVRPIVLARYDLTKDFGSAASFCSQILQINILMCAVIAVAAGVGGVHAFSALSNGKYGLDALIIFMALLMVLVLETQRQQIDLLVQITRRYQDLIFSNAIISSSIILAAVSVQLVGGVAFPLANLLGLAVANWVANRKIEEKSGELHFDWLTTCRILVGAGMAFFLGESAEYLGLHWLAASMLALASYGIYIYINLRDLVLAFWKNAISGVFNFGGVDSGNDISQSPSGFKIAFGVLSSKESAAAIDQLASAVYPHPLYVHHDFSKSPEFSPIQPNIHVLKDPVATAWGDWSLVAATYRLMREALKDPEVRYFQLLSESCMLVQPVSKFEGYLHRERPDAMLDFVSLHQIEALRSHGWRYITGAGFWRRFVRKLSRSAFPEHLKKAEHGVNLVDSRAATGGVLPSLADWWLKACLVSLTARLQGETPCHLAIGSQWLCVSSRVARHLLLAQERGGNFYAHFEKSHIPDEAYFQSLIAGLRLAYPDLKINPSNHILFWENNGTGPDLISMERLEGIKSSGKFFARKFSLDMSDEVRIAMTGRGI